VKNCVTVGWGEGLLIKQSLEVWRRYIEDRGPRKGKKSRKKKGVGARHRKRGYSGRPRKERGTQVNTEGLNVESISEDSRCCEQRRTREAQKRQITNGGVQGRVGAGR